MTVAALGFGPSHFCPGSPASSFIPALGLCNVENPSQFSQIRDAKTRLNSQRIQWELTAINSANFESKTHRADNIEAVRRNEKYSRRGYLALLQH